MKNLIFTALILLFLTACEYTDVKNHTPAPSDTYCAYDAKGAGEGKIRVCVYCPMGSAMCGTIKTARVLVKQNPWYIPNVYEKYELTPAANVNGCLPCTGSFIWEKE